MLFAHFPLGQYAIADEARLHLEMTRATDFLELSCDRDSVFVRRLEGVIVES